MRIRVSPNCTAEGGVGFGARSLSAESNRPTEPQPSQSMIRGNRTDCDTGSTQLWKVATHVQAYRKLSIPVYLHWRVTIVDAGFYGSSTVFHVTRSMQARIVVDREHPWPRLTIRADGSRLTCTAQNTKTRASKRGAVYAGLHTAHGPLAGGITGV